MLHKIETELGIGIHRFVRPHQMPIGLMIMVLAPSLAILRLF